MSETPSEPAGEAPPPQAVVLWGVPALVAVVALVQILFVHTLDLTAWKGAGFGMFSTIDGNTDRVLRAEVVLDGRSLAVEPPDFGARKNVTSLPSQRNLSGYGELLAESVWTSDVAGVHSASLWSPPAALPDGAFLPEAVRISVHRPVFDKESGELRYEPIRTVEVAGASRDAVAARLGIDAARLRGGR